MASQMPTVGSPLSSSSSNNSSNNNNDDDVDVDDDIDEEESPGSKKDALALSFVKKLAPQLKKLVVCLSVCVSATNE